MTFPEAVQEIMPPDNEFVVGTVVSGNPLTVDVRGGEIRPGRLSTTGLTTGDPVMMIREGAAWGALGKLVSASTTGLGLTGLQWAASNAILALTAAEQDVPGTTIAFTTTSPAARVLAVWFGDYQVLAAATAVGVTMLRIDGVTAVSPSATFQDVTSGNRGTTGNISLTTVTPGSHTAVLRANRVGGADGQLQLNSLHTTLLLAVFE